MKQHKLEHGSTHVIVIVILVIALIGALGWIFWQNLQKNDQAASNSSKDTAKQTSKDKTRVELVQASISPDFGTVLTFEYPKTWQYSSQVTGDKQTTWGEKITISSPSGEYEVNYAAAQGGGLGGTCEPEDIGKVSSLEYESLAGFPDMSLAVLSLSGMDELYDQGILSRNGYVGLMKTSIAKDLQAGDTACELVYAGMQELDTTNSTLLSNAIINIDGVTSPDEFKKKLSGEEYEQAKAILLSTKH